MAVFELRKVFSMKYKANPIAVKWYNVLKDAPDGFSMAWIPSKYLHRHDQEWWTLSIDFGDSFIEDKVENFEEFFNKLYEEEEFNGLIPLPDDEFVYVEGFYIDGGAHIHHNLSMKNVDERANCWSFEISKEYDNWMTKVESELVIGNFDSDKFYSFEGNVFIQDGQWVAIVVIYMQSDNPLSWEEHFYFPLNDVKYDTKYENCIAVHKEYLAPLGQWIHDMAKELIK